MITEDYVSFETAKLLKEKGFDWECRAFYVKSKECGIELFHAKEPYNYNNNVHPCTSAPTLQMAMKWLREIHKLGVFPSTYTSLIASNTTHIYGTAIINLKTYELMTADYMARDTYEEACEAAIKYCLENLI